MVQAETLAVYFEVDSSAQELYGAAQESIAAGDLGGAKRQLESAKEAVDESAPHSEVQRLLLAGDMVYADVRAAATTIGELRREMDGYCPYVSAPAHYRKLDEVYKGFARLGAREVGESGEPADEAVEARKKILSTLAGRAASMAAGVVLTKHLNNESALFAIPNAAPDRSLVAQQHLFGEKGAHGYLKTGMDQTQTAINAALGAYGERSVNGRLAHVGPWLERYRNAAKAANLPRELRLRSMALLGKTAAGDAALELIARRP